MPSKQPSGFAGFLLIWLGQVVSILASNMTQFGLTIWMYQQTESATAMGLMQVFFMAPLVILSPLAGVWVDRYNRKFMMMISDLLSAIGTGGVFILFATGHLQFWHLYFAAFLNGTGSTFQWPAYSAAITTMIPKEQLGRANGLMSLMEAGPGVIAPMLAGALLPLIQLTGILTIDVVTFFIAIAALLMVQVPQPRLSAEGQQEQAGFFQQAVYGFRFILARPGLLGLQSLFLFGNLFTGIAFAVLAPMILARTNQNSITFGAVQTAGAIGEIVGGIAMSAWGGFHRRVHGVLIGKILLGLAGISLMGLPYGLPVWIAAMAVEGITHPMINASNQSIWQAKVPQDLQGRVFAARRIIAVATTPIAPIIGGVLSDYVLEPAMRTPSGLSHAFGWLVGTGPGAGMGLLMIIMGVLASAVGMVGYLIPAVREVEDRLPDHDTVDMQPVPSPAD